MGREDETEAHFSVTQLELGPRGNNDYGTTPFVPWAKVNLASLA